jgi:serine phosphatase RsbU (regulator of sigma subunit)
MPENEPNLGAETSVLLPMELESGKGTSIRFKLALYISLMVTLFLAGLSTFILMQARQALIKETTNRGIIIGRSLALYSNSALLSDDFLNAASFTKDAMENDGMVYAVLTKETGEIVASKQLAGRQADLSVGQSFNDPPGEPIEVSNVPDNTKVQLAIDPSNGQSLLTFNFPVLKAGVLVGYAHIALSQHSVQEVVNSVTEDVVILVVIFLVVAILASLFFSGIIVRPVSRLTRGALAIGAGNLDTQIKVEGNDELGMLARSFNAMTLSLKKAQAELVEKQLLQQELNIAQEIQQGLLPKKIPVVPGYEIAAFYAPAKEVGGDYYDFIRMGPNRLAFTVADVSGKSVPGSLGMTMARSVLRSQALSNNLPGETLRKTNEVIQPDIRRGMFVTMFYSVLDSSTHTVQSANAGHNPAFKIKADGRVEEISPEGIALGLVEAKQFYIEEHTMTMDRGDLLVLYTDGVTEAMNAASKEYGEERFQESLVRHAKEPIEDCCHAIIADLHAFVAGAPPHDDITLLLVRRSS